MRAGWRGCERTLLKAKTAQALPTELTSRADHAANFLIENPPGHHGFSRAIILVQKVIYTY